MIDNGMTVSRWGHWREINRQLWRLGLVGVAMLTLMRGLLLWMNAPTPLTAPTSDLLQAFWIGLRFDAKIMAVLLGPWLLVATLLLVLPRPFIAIWRRLWLPWALVCMLLVNLLSLVNHFFFSFYQGPINSLIFGLFEDDTRAVIDTVWSDYPLLALLVALAGMTGAQLAWMRRGGRRDGRRTGRQKGRRDSIRDSRRRSHHLGWPRASVMVVVSLVALIGLGRGSLGTFPLREMNMAVSANAFVNDLVPSGPQALYLAWKERELNNIGDNPRAGLEHYGFSSPVEAARALGWTEVDNADEVLERMTLTTPRRPAAEEAPPHVVVSLMESWGRRPLDFDDPESNDLLGRLRPWLEGKADYFPHALSAENGTHPSLEGLLLDTPISPLTQSRYGYRSFSTSAALPYRRDGYRTVFLTAGSVQWRDLDDALRRQGFDQVLGSSAIRERFPEATGGTWGLDDEWMFRTGAELLREADARGEKVMLVMLSITNHPPYHVPDHYTPAPLDVTQLGDSLAVSPEFGTSILETYQYANDAMGGFLDRLESDGLLGHTLFAATGDHNSRSIIQYPDAHDLFDQFGVPILVWLPPRYRQQATAQREDWTSHRDIFPTLWAHSLSKAEVPWVGRDLYAPVEKPMALSFNRQDGGAGLLVSKQGAATNLAQPTFYDWQEGRGLAATETPSDALREQARQARARLALEDWRIRRQALGEAGDGG
ncbi:phosphoglycerol transferase MdoB-like AlkP superfamily enzyme [Onishia taeanensis]|uniref:Phosphoglycerol transferase MdoB-like AlkP superfamily enzyme n=1 Tax=Onishia taeanensis TaxID=284577 RepID=A0A328XTR4_9GAMM|nr:LTA synthase family protein [Halomonas taeanensis]RAR62202.1 phosphoglycerol transferase MdoB-like AlkP superfamily enzyme [Halomonas taeanensis]